MNVELTEDEMRRKVRDLQTKVEDLTELVNALLSVITEEPDGVSSGGSSAWQSGPCTALHVIQPFTTTFGRTLHIGLSNPAVSEACMTSSTSLYTSGASSERARSGVGAR